MKSSIRNKKGFTIVELVIVIAVIAILAAVLIPTFANLVEKANESKDTQLIRNLNVALRLENTDGEKYSTAHAAVSAAAKGGFELSAIAASQDGNYILWDASKQCFAYYNGDEVVYAPETGDGEETQRINLWKITDNLDDDGFSVYYTGKETTVSTTVGFDAGSSNISEITYTGTGTANVIIRTNGGSFNVNNASTEVYHYGSAATVTLTSVKTYHECGTATTMNAYNSAVVIEKGAIVQKITKDYAVTVTTNDGGIIINGADENGGDKDSYVLEIGTAAQLADFRDSVNAGITYKGLTVKLTSNIDLGGYANWNPIGNRYTLQGENVVDWDTTNESAVRRIFMGTFDGQGHVISNMNINSLADNYPGLRSAAGDVSTSSYAALFGYVSDATLKNFTVGGTVVGVDVAGVVGITGGTCTIENVISNVRLTGTNGSNENDEVRGKVAGFVSCPKGDSLTIKNCTNNGDISGSSQKNNYLEPVGGFVAFQALGTLTIENCTNNGIITHANQTAGGFVGCVEYGNNIEMKKITITNCTNTGSISGYYAGAAVGRIGNAQNGSTQTLTHVGFQNSGTISKTNNWTNNCNDYVGCYQNYTYEESASSYTRNAS